MAAFRKLFGLIWILELIVSGAAFAQDQSPKVSSLVALQKNVISIVRWNVRGGDLFCVFSEKGENGPGGKITLPTRSMTIYRQNGGKFERIFQFETPDWLLNAFPLGELDGRLFVSWGGGSGYHFTVFAYLQGKVQQVLGASSRGMPEIVIDADECESILVSEMEFADGKYSRSGGKTGIFRWRGTQYDKIGVVPWSERFLSFSRPPHPVMQ